jgi:hypothetical protein
MAKLWETIRSFLAKLWGKSDAQQRSEALAALEAELTGFKRDNTDALESLKEEIRTLEALALRKKRELEKVHGDSRRIIVGEMERVFRDLDRLQDRETIIAANLNRLAVALAKLREARDIRKAGVNEEQSDDIALELQELHTGLRETDRAVRDLERERYVAPATNPVDTEERMAELTEEEKAPTDLSPEAERRLRQLEAEEA